jgi:HEAT repeat protein
MEEGRKKPRLDPIFIKDLRSGDEKTVLKALMNLRSAGSIHYIPELLALLNTTSSEVVERELVRFIADIRDPSAVPFILAGLRDPSLAGARGNIVSACWQSGHDFSGETGLFVRLFLEGDYPTALESFTVIEESIINLDPEALDRVRGEVLGGLEQLSEEKKPLALELVKLLST